MAYVIASFYGRNGPVYLKITGTGHMQSHEWVSDYSDATQYSVWGGVADAYKWLAGSTGDNYLFSVCSIAGLAGFSTPSKGIALLQAQIASIEDSLGKPGMDIFQGGQKYTVLHATKKHLTRVLDTLSQAS